MSERCKITRCGAEVLWVTTTNAKRMCLDAAPSPTGTFELDESGTGVIARFVPPSERVGRIDLYEFHTCVVAASQPGHGVRCSSCSGGLHDHPKRGCRTTVDGKMCGCTR